MTLFLANKKSLAELEKDLAAEPFNREVASFYRYTPIRDPQSFRDRLYKKWIDLGVLGRIYVAQEGINAQFSVPEHQWQAFLQSLEDEPELQNMDLNRSEAPNNRAFLKLTIKVRSKIVSDGLKEDIFLASTIGTHLDPMSFHEKLSDPQALIVDVRNDYECDIGHFENAFLPDSRTFDKVLSELNEKLQEHKEKDLLLYCTGGIRCEKTSAYLKSKGYQSVFQLKGGIISYLKEMKEKNIAPKFKGSMFVFDGRMAEPSVGEIIGRCIDCGKLHGKHVDCADKACTGLIIQCESCAEKSPAYCPKGCTVRLA
ncbi:MAG: rhodanese-related sulfurtransferase [Bdellovibrionales bacterium]|nr:rhodanese-related sulfurtransferase [Bdellovibrionales bacterium]